LKSSAQNKLIGTNKAPHLKMVVMLSLNKKQKTCPSKTQGEIADREFNNKVC
jgi:hypothetical protein